MGNKEAGKGSDIRGLQDRVEFRVRVSSQRRKEWAHSPVVSTKNLGESISQSNTKHRLSISRDLKIPPST